MAASITCKIIGLPARECKTLALSDFIRVPLPAARIIAAKLFLTKPWAIF
jgi:hypothetical protein